MWVLWIGAVRPSVHVISGVIPHPPIPIQIDCQKSIIENHGRAHTTSPLWKFSQEKSLKHGIKALSRVCKIDR